MVWCIPSARQVLPSLTCFRISITCILKLVRSPREMSRFWHLSRAPPKILCLAGNYQEHVIESGMERAAKRDITPRVFLKPSSCITGPSSDILLPRTSTQVDWELELGVVIGRKGKYIRAADAINYIAGYVIFNDVSAEASLSRPSGKLGTGMNSSTVQWQMAGRFRHHGALSGHQR